MGVGGSIPFTSDFAAQFSDGAIIVTGEGPDARAAPTSRCPRRVHAGLRGRGTLPRHAGAPVRLTDARCRAPPLGWRNDYRTDRPGSRVLARRVGVGRGRRRVACRRPRRHRGDAARSRVGRRRPIRDHHVGPRRRDLRGSQGRGGSRRARRAQRGRGLRLRRERPRPGADRGHGLRRLRSGDGCARPGPLGRGGAPADVGGARRKTPATVSRDSPPSSSRPSGGGRCRSRAPPCARPPC